ncbi:plasmid pRiA4b ORF-3 family protein [Sinorhizobium meliloti]|nr:plasmid pRiA4b ORF-3 family protein [Sinorhizobium meliloti]MDE4589081.1 plasmid pRiA4b ORF-3 family protein [Sinorhizobium meliloti]
MIVAPQITLDHVEPTVMRRVAVPFRIKLHRLHEVLQAAMGWSNSHLYEFRIRDVGFGLADQDWGDGPLDARKISLLVAIDDIGAKSFKYLYDFGDGWTHSIRIERTFPVIGLAEPMLLEATGRCPPEDIGGPWGYQDFRDALADPTHERHAELIEWWGSEDYGPDKPNFSELNKAVDDLVAMWARKSRRKI